MGIICLRSEEWSWKLQHVLLPTGVVWRQGWAALPQLLGDTQKKRPHLSFPLPWSTLLLLVMRSGHKVSSKFTPLAKEHLLFCQRSFFCNFAELNQLALHQMSAGWGQAVVLRSQKQLGRERDGRKKQGTFTFDDEMLTWLMVYSV